MLNSPGKADIEEKQLVLCWEGGQNDQGRHGTRSQWHAEGNLISCRVMSLFFARADRKAVT